MNTRRFAMVGGLVMLVMGLLALMPTFYQSVLEAGLALPPLDVEASYGLAFGVFPMNVFNKLALIFFGLMGIAAARQGGMITNTGDALVGSDPSINAGDPDRSSVLWSRWVFWVMGGLAILGMIPATETLFGLWPLFGAEVWLHAIFAALGGVFGYSNRAQASLRRKTLDRVRPFRRAGAA